MQAKTKRRIHLVTKTLITLMMLASVFGMYFTKTAEVQAEFAKLGYPGYLVVPLGVVKLLGLAAIWLVPVRSLKEWAYAGFFFDFVLAFFAHFMVNDNEYAPALAATVLLLAAYLTRPQPGD